MMVNLNLEPVREVMKARSLLHGGGKGAPRLNAQQNREGAAMNRAAMVSLAASLEAYVEDVFLACVDKRYSNFSPENLEKVKKQLKIPHTTSPDKIQSSFLVIGVPDIFSGLRWQKCKNENVREKLNVINQVRNRCAHGHALTYNGRPFRLTVPVLWSFFNYATQFGKRFEAHAFELTS